MPKSKAVWNFTGGSDGKESACSAGDLGLIPWSGKSPGEGNGYTLQYSNLENSMGKGVWQHDKVTNTTQDCVREEAEAFL